jgi:uncharacterized protein (TIGR02284 family)
VAYCTAGNISRVGAIFPTRVFLRRAGDCAAGASQLQILVARLGGKPEDSGTVAGAVHRGWVNLKAAVSGRTDLAILEECERGEDLAKASYTKALGETLPVDIRLIVQRQYEGVVSNHDQIRNLRDRYGATKT